MKKRRLYILLSAFFLSFTIQFATAQESGSSSAFLDAVQYYIHGDFQKALGKFKSITDVDGQNDAAWYYMGLCNVGVGNRDAARECMAKAVSIDSTNYWYREALISTYNPYDNLDLTIAQYEKLLRDFPKKTERQYVLVNLYIAAGDTDKAIELIDEIEGRDGKSDATVMTRTSILRSKQKMEEAVEVMKEYVEEYSSPYILSILGEYEMGLYNDTEALKYFDEALSLDESYFPAKLGRAETFRLTRKYPQYFQSLKDVVSDPDASSQEKSDYLVQVLRSTELRFATNFKPQLDTVINMAVNAHPKDSTMLNLATAYNLYIGDNASASFYAKVCSELYPGSLASAYGYIETLVRGEDWAAAATACKDALKRFPTEPAILEMDSYAKYQLKDYAGVLENAKTMLEVAKGDSTLTLNALSTMGDMYHQMGDSKNCYKCYERALKVNPSYCPVLNNYAWYLCQEGKSLKKALKMSRKTVEMEPRNATYLDTYGWILHLTGNTLEAKLFFKQAMLHGGKESATIMAHYIVVLESLGEKDLADVYREQLKRLPSEDE